MNFLGSFPFARTREKKNRLFVFILRVDSDFIIVTVDEIKMTKNIYLKSEFSLKFTENLFTKIIRR